ncbi:molybdopterin-dependent oxidoreductase [Sneathiella sp. P13V-1]|uniref:molybdopterin-containing oxidoreductase family protein n=1 Tax=Sneathiella sp. P13V-1 TaxID=2697366 RepID=UPI00187B1A81|nr:molybdopterin-dependent oxidoreductase [Sneathiella sp. P13V-1]MBE7637821.1 molybdopterin-dependent oxidoreductase [Sneathiella sp. P13V-1]
MTIVPSVCPLDCPDTCSFDVTVEDNKVVKVRGSTANPITRGVICNKVSRSYPEFVHGDGRILTPLKRVGPRGKGEFVEITWDEALDAVRERFTDIIDEFGSEAILPLNYAGPHGMLAGGSMDMRFFHRLGASRLHRSAMCGGIKSTAFKATLGPVGAMQPEQIVHSKLIIVWGNNVTFSNLHLAPLIKEAKKKGAKLIVVDPKKIKIADQADMYLPVKPGTDVVLAFAIAAELERIGALDEAFMAEHVKGADEYLSAARELTIEEASDICGISVQDIQSVAELYASTNPAVIAMGNGLERNQNGGNGVRAILGLPAIAGKFGVRGGGVIGGAGNLFPKTSEKLTRPDLLPKETRTLNILDVGRHLDEDDLDTPLKGVFIYNHNPVIVAPDQNQMKRALSREDLFIVGSDVVMTDSMRYADIVLPASTHFEHDDIFCAYGQPYVQRADAVISPVGQSLPNTEIFRRLADRFGFNEAPFKATDEELMDEALDGADPRFEGVRPSQIPVGTAISMEKELGEVILFKNVFPKTPSGKIELLSDELGEKFGQRKISYNPLKSEYPLTLISPSSNKLITSTFGGLKQNDAAPTLEMHPLDAKARELSSGDKVRVHNELGEVFLELEVTEAVRPGVLCSPKGFWFKTTDNDQTVSALAPTTKADLCEGACYNDARVEVEGVN